MRSSLFGPGGAGCNRLLVDPGIIATLERGAKRASKNSEREDINGKGDTTRGPTKIPPGLLLLLVQLREGRN